MRLLFIIFILLLTSFAVIAQGDNSTLVVKGFDVVALTQGREVKGKKSFSVTQGRFGALHVVERLLGTASAKLTARAMEYNWQPQKKTGVKK